MDAYLEEEGEERKRGMQKDNGVREEIKGEEEETEGKRDREKEKE